MRRWHAIALLLVLCSACEGPADSAGGAAPGGDVDVASSDAVGGDGAVGSHDGIGDAGTGSDGAADGGFVGDDGLGDSVVDGSSSDTATDASAPVDAVDDGATPSDSIADGGGLDTQDDADGASLSDTDPVLTDATTDTDAALSDAVADADGTSGADGDSTGTPEDAIGDAADAASEDADVAETWPGPFVYDGPGYPTWLPEFGAPKSISGLGGFYQCEEVVPIPSGADVPGPCVMVQYEETGKPDAFHKYGYDCLFRLRVIDTYYAGETMPLYRTEFDWNDSGQPTREEYWNFNKGKHELQVWDYYDNGLLSEYHNERPNLEEHSYHTYTLDAEGRIIEEIREITRDEYNGAEVYIFSEHHAWEYDEEGRPVWHEWKNGPPNGPAMTLIYANEWEYDELGRVITERTYWPDDTVTDSHTYIPLGEDTVDRIERFWDDGTTVTYIPERENTYDALGRKVLERFELKDQQNIAQCAYGPCWYTSHGIKGTTYTEWGEVQFIRLWASDFDYNDDVPWSISVWSFDAHNRRVRGAGWGQVWKAGIPSYLASLGTTLHYECWDNGTAYEAEWTP